MARQCPKSSDERKSESGKTEGDPIKRGLMTLDRTSMLNGGKKRRHEKNRTSPQALCPVRRSKQKNYTNTSPVMGNEEKPGKLKMQPRKKKNMGIRPARAKTTPQGLNHTTKTRTRHHQSAEP